ncbi:LysR family transcriptional regulator [Dictyobacter aurantiacus]|uniref:LysR family transcriptional regulator n=1 Tax=Dictyobacter aurantiacus TaxID=1936993 RepID=A0A401ZNN0_9CHLR|nr:LysR family transcriptional regulator [Dictyobacter aurantiacus]GCE08465.1 LysR family transcriptional regulator [Dictyobacter aurantiacus]
MDLLQLRYFQTVARHEHMTRAAEELTIAQPSLSKMIAHLEKELGVPLFDRQGRQIRLNKFGQIFLRRVERAFFELDEGKRELQDMAGLEHGSIGIGTANVNLLAEILSVFCARYPAISFRLFQQPNLAMVEQLEHGEIDICLASPPVERAGIGWIALMTEEIFLIVPGNHRLADRESIDLSEVANDAFVSVKPGYGLRDITDRYCQQAGFTPKIIFEGDEPAAIRGLVRAGLGITFTSAVSWQTIIQQPDPLFSVLRIDRPICQRTIGLAWSQERYLSLAARQFRQFVIDYFAYNSETLAHLPPSMQAKASATSEDHASSLSIESNIPSNS